MGSSTPAGPPVITEKDSSQADAEETPAAAASPHQRAALVRQSLRRRPRSLVPIERAVAPRSTAKDEPKK